MTEGREQFAMAVVLLGILVTGIVGFGLNAVASAVEGRLLRWRVRGV
jgi:sulfonate transport system permease protein